MPTVLRLDGLRVTIYPDDHRPAHVHVTGGGGEVVFLLNCPEGPSELRESYGFSTKDVGRIQRNLAPHVSELCKKWVEIHGPY